jgi:hypothetical protein
MVFVTGMIVGEELFESFACANTTSEKRRKVKRQEAFSIGRILILWLS